MMVRPRVAWVVLSVVVGFLVVTASCVGLAQATTYGGVTFPLGNASFADRIVVYVQGSCVRCAFSHSDGVLGPPDCGGPGCWACGACDPCSLSLGYRLSEIDNRAYVTAEFVDNRLIDGPGNDLFIYATNDKPARVEISADGVNFIRVGETTGYPGALDIGPYVQPGQEFRFVRVSDVPNDEDKSSCPGPSIDAIGAMGRAILRQYALSVTIVGSGSVTKFPDQATYMQGATVSLQAMPSAGWSFVGWSGAASGSVNPLLVVMDADKSITATFATVAQTGTAQGILELLPTGDLAFLAGGQTATNLLIVLDVSTSMGEAFEGSTKLAVAKRVLGELVDTIPAGTIVGLRTFGGCDEVSQLLVPVGPVNPSTMKAKIQSIELAGATAIQYALEQAKLDFANISGSRQILLLSDGGEDCGGDPVGYVKKLIASGYSLKINVVGYGVIAGDQATRLQLEEIARTTGGSFVIAATSQDLRAALQLSAPVRYHVFDSQGAEKHTGTLGDTVPPLPVGTYRVVIDTTPPTEVNGVVVSAGRTTQITIKRSDGAYQAEVSK